MLFAAFTGANSIKQFVENVTSSDASMSRLAKQLNMSTADLTAWTNAIERTGGSATAAAGTFQSLEDNIQQFRMTGQSNLVPYFRAMGIAMLDAHGNARPLQDILLDISKWAEGKDPAMVSQRLRAMGFDDGTINLLMKGRDAVAGLIQQSKELGVTNDADGQRAQALQERWRALEQAATSLGRTILNDLSPMVIDILGKMVQWAQVNREWIDTKIGEAIQVVIQKATEFSQYLATVDWSTVWKTLIEWITQVQLQFSAWFDYLKQHWPEIKQFAVDMAGSIAAIASVIDTVVKATTGWGDVAKILFAAWAIGKFAPIIGGLTAILRLLTGVTAAAVGLSGKGAAGLFGGMLGKAALAAVLADMGVTAVDPDDKMGTWIDRNIPGAGYLDDLAARRLGIGRTYEEQDRAAGAAGYGEPRGIRNNNPLNLEYRQGQGAVSSDGRFGVYANMEGGVAAASRQLLLYQDRDHLNTLKSIINKWAPASDNNDTAGYVKQVSGMLNIDPDQQIDLHDQNMMAALVIAMAKRETGKKLAPDVVLRGVGQALPPSAPSPVLGSAPMLPKSPVADLSTGAATSPRIQTSQTSTTNTSTSEINVNGPITVQTQATDAKGVAGGLMGALKSSQTVQQANTGLN
jgi:hypothetical protein